MASPPDRNVEILDRDSRSARLTVLARLASAPFPFEPDPASGPEPFFNATDPASGERIRTVDGRQYGEAAHYRDNRVLIHAPPAFNPTAPATVLLFLHGHNAVLSDIVIGKHAVARQVNRSQTNTLLIAPQMAYDAADSHPGKLSRPAGAATLLRAAGAILGNHFNVDPMLTVSAPIVLAAFSGGYRAAADCLTVGGLERRVAGLLLLDALYGRLDDFARWKTTIGKEAFLVALFGEGTAQNTDSLTRRLRQAGCPIRTRLPTRLDAGPVAIIPCRAPHSAIPTAGPPRWPITEVLRRRSMPPAGA